MRVIVTGGAGFIGSHLAATYLQQGHDVAVVDDLSTGRKDAVPPGAEFARIDITDADSISEFWHDFQPDLVNHHAAQADVRLSVDDPAFDADVNIIGTLNVVKSSVDIGVRRFIQASTGGAIYGEPDTLPVGEDVPPCPLSFYGTSKYCVEEYLNTFRRLEGLSCTVLRYANVYGPGQRPDGEAGVVAIFAGQMLRGKRPTIFGSGDKTRDYVYVDDVVRANLLAFDGPPGRVYNVGTGIRTTDQEVFDAVAEAAAYDKEPMYGNERKGEVRHICLDPSRIMNELDWHPSVQFSDGVRRTVQHLRRRLIDTGEIAQ